MTNRVGGLKMQFFHAPLVCAFLSDSFGRRQDGEEHCPPSVTFAALCDCKMQKNFHHATILQFISSLFETQRSSEKSSRKCSMKKSLDPYVLIWQRMHSLYLGEWSSETLLFPEQNYQLQKSNKKESTSKGSNFFVE